MILLAFSARSWFTVVTYASICIDNYQEEQSIFRIPKNYAYYILNLITGT